MVKFTKVFLVVPAIISYGKGANNMENKDRLLVALLIVSISFNVYSLVRTNALEEDLKLQMDGLANAIHSRLNSVVGQVSDVSYQVGKIAQEQEWLLKNDFALNLDKSGPGQVYLLLDFTLREVEEGARALVHYRVAGGLDWTAVAAEAIGGNTFRAELAVSGDSVYQYKVQVNERVSEEKHIPSDFYVAGHIYPQINGVAKGDKVQLDLWLNSTGNILLNPPVRIKVNYSSFAGVKHP